VQTLKTNIECKVAKIISKEELQQKLNYTGWNHVIKKRMNFLEHLLRLYPETSAERSNRSKAEITTNQREDQKRYG